jgi:single-strand DNA-binding protein
MAGRSLNRVLLIGNLGKDPEVSYTASGIAVAKFSLATNERWKDDSGNLQERTEWHNLVAWAKLAEVSGQYLKKGSNVFIEGRIQTRSWDDKTTGTKRYITEIVVGNLIMLGSKPAGASDHDLGSDSSPVADTSGPEKDDLPF